MSSKPYLYDFYIIATADGGATLMQKVFIYNFIDCNDDVVILKNSLPGKKDPNYNLYVVQD